MDWEVSTLTDQSLDTCQPSYDTGLMAHGPEIAYIIFTVNRTGFILKNCRDACTDVRGFGGGPDKITITTLIASNVNSSRLSSTLRGCCIKKVKNLQFKAIFDQLGLGIA